MKLSTESQCRAILGTLKTGRSITPIDALKEFGCFRLAARICDLRRNGYSIDTVMESDEDGQKRWARYSLAKHKGMEAV